MTRTEKIIRRLAGNFVLRNLLIFAILPAVITGVPLALGELTPKLLAIEALLMCNSYVSFLIHNLVFYPYFIKRGRYLLYIISVIALLMISSRVYSNMRLFFFQEENHDYTWQKWVALYWVELIYYWASLCVYLAYIYYRDRERLFQVDRRRKNWNCGN